MNRSSRFRVNSLVFSTPLLSKHCKTRGFRVIVNQNHAKTMCFSHFPCQNLQKLEVFRPFSSKTMQKPMFFFLTFYLSKPALEVLGPFSIQSMQTPSCFDSCSCHKVLFTHTRFQGHFQSRSFIEIAF